MPDIVRIPDPLTVFECSAGAFEADPFDIWKAVKDIGNEEKNDDVMLDKIKQWVQETYKVFISKKQAAWFYTNIAKICLEKKSEYSPSAETSAEPAATTDSLYSDYPNEEL